MMEQMQQAISTGLARNSMGRQSILGHAVHCRMICPAVQCRLWAMQHADPYDVGKQLAICHAEDVDIGIIAARPCCACLQASLRSWRSPQPEQITHQTHVSLQTIVDDRHLLGYQPHDACPRAPLIACPSTNIGSLDM